MTPHREQTTNGNQPVRFYKLIALTFLLITIILLGIIVFTSSKRAVIVIETKATPVEVNATATIGSGGENTLDGFVTSTFVTVTEKFLPTGSKTVEGVSKGTVKLYNETSADATLVATTRLLSPDGILFRLKSKVVIPAKGQLETEVYADKQGADSDIGPTKFTIPGLSQEKQKFIYATSEVQMQGGKSMVGSISAEDLQEAQQKALLALQEEGKKLLNVVSAGKTGVYKSENISFSSDATVGKEVSDFSVTAKGSVVGVFYDSDKALSWANSMLAKRAIDDVELVQPGKEEPTLLIRDYDLDKNQASMDLAYTGVATLNPESQEISKVMFMGKNRDEVRRYVLQLDHVRGVDIKFSPAWVMTVPVMPDHVSVVVKQVN